VSGQVVDLLAVRRSRLEAALVFATDLDALAFARNRAEDLADSCEGQLLIDAVTARLELDQLAAVVQACIEMLLNEHVPFGCRCAEGRDVEVDEDRLNFDPATRRLTLTGAGSRKQAARTRHLDELVPAVVAFVAKNPQVTGNQIGKGLRAAEVSFQKGDDSKAAAMAVEQGLLVSVPGPRKASLYSTAPTAPRLPHGVVVDCPDCPLCGGAVNRADETHDCPSGDLSRTAAHDPRSELDLPAEQVAAAERARR